MAIFSHNFAPSLPVPGPGTALHSYNFLHQPCICDWDYSAIICRAILSTTTLSLICFYSTFVSSALLCSALVLSVVLWPAFPGQAGVPCQDQGPGSRFHCWRVKPEKIGQTSRAGRAVRAVVERVECGTYNWARSHTQEESVPARLWWWTVASRG